MSYLWYDRISKLRSTVTVPYPSFYEAHKAEPNTTYLINSVF